MYNRYVPGNNGIYERQTVETNTQSKSCVPQKEEVILSTSNDKATAKRDVPNCFPLDIGDLLLLCIMLLLLMESNEDDLTSILITAAAFLFLQ